MKRRPPPRSPVVVTKPSKRPPVAPTTEPRRPPLDRRIRAWSADDPDRLERERIERKSATDKWEEGMEWWKRRHSQANDPSVLDEAARVGVGHAMIDATMSNWV